MTSKFHSADKMQRRIRNAPLNCLKCKGNATINEKEDELHECISRLQVNEDDDEHIRIWKVKLSC